MVEALGANFTGKSIYTLNNEDSRWMKRQMLMNTSLQ